MVAAWTEMMRVCLKQRSFIDNHTHLLQLNTASNHMQFIDIIIWIHKHTDLYPLGIKSINYS